MYAKLRSTWSTHTTCLLFSRPDFCLANPSWFRESHALGRLHLVHLVHRNKTPASSTDKLLLGSVFYWYGRLLARSGLFAPTGAYGANKTPPASSIGQASCVHSSGKVRGKRRKKAFRKIKRQTKSEGGKERESVCVCVCVVCVCVCERERESVCV